MTSFSRGLLSTQRLLFKGFPAFGRGPNIFSYGFVTSRMQSSTASPSGIAPPQQFAKFHVEVALQPPQAGYLSFSKAAPSPSPLHKASARPRAVDDAASFVGSVKTVEHLEAAIIWLKSIVRSAPISSFQAVLESAARIGSRECALQVEEIALTSRRQLDATCYAHIMHACGKVNGLKEAESVFKRMREANVQPNLFSYNVLLTWLYRASEWNALFDTFDELQRAGIRPKISTFNIAIAACVQKANKRKAFALFEQLKALGELPNVKTFSSLIDVCAHAGDAVGAQATFDDMARFGVKPNELTFTCLLNAYALASCDLDALFDVFARIPSFGLRPNVFHFNVLVNACATHQRLDRALALIADMSAAGLTPSTITFNALINASRKSGDIDAAFLVLERMRAANLRPDVRTMTELASACCQGGDVTRAMEVVKEMEQRGPAPNEFTYGVVISALALSGRASEALDILSVMVKRNVKPSVVVYGALIDGLGRERRVDELVELMRAIRADKIPLDRRAAASLAITAAESGSATLFEISRECRRQVESQDVRF